MAPTSSPIVDKAVDTIKAMLLEMAPRLPSHEEYEAAAKQHGSVVVRSGRDVEGAPFIQIRLDGLTTTTQIAMEGEHDN